MSVLPPLSHASLWAEVRGRERVREVEKEEQSRTTAAMMTEKEEETNNNDTGDAYDHLDRVRSKLIALRDAVVLLGTTPAEEGGEEEGSDAETFEPPPLPPPPVERENPSQQQQQGRRGRGEDDQQSGLPESEPEEIHHSWTIHSQEGCRIGEVCGGTDPTEWAGGRASGLIVAGCLLMAWSIVTV